MSEFSNAAPSCPLTCENVGQSCTNRVGRNPGCYCKKGNVLDCLGNCVKASDYCKTCPDNEYYTECGAEPEADCKNQNQTSITTVPKCVCKTNYVRNYTGECIKPSECPSKSIF